MELRSPFTFFILFLNLSSLAMAQGRLSPWDIHGEERRHDSQMVNLDSQTQISLVKSLGFETKEPGESPALPIKTEEVTLEVAFRTRSIDDEIKTEIPAIVLIDADRKAVGLITHLYFWNYDEESRIRIYFPILGEVTLLTLEKTGKTHPFYAIPSPRVHGDRILFRMSNGGMRIIDSRTYRSFQNSGNYLIDIGTTFGEVVNPDSRTTYSTPSRPTILPSLFSDDDQTIVHMRVQMPSGVFMYYADVNSGEVFEQWLQEGFQDAQLSPSGRQLFRRMEFRGGSRLQFVNFDFRRDEEKYQTSTHFRDIQKVIWPKDSDRPWVLRFDPNKRDPQVLLSRIDPFDPANLKDTYFVAPLREFEKPISDFNSLGDGRFRVEDKIVDTNVN